jgi:hypothetical protein
LWRGDLCLRNRFYRYTSSTATHRYSFKLYFVRATKVNHWSLAI